MSYRNFLDELKKGMPATGYVLTSSDPFLLTEAFALLRELVPQDERDFNFHFFDLLNGGGSNIPLEQIMDVLNTAPFFSDGRKFVVIGNFQKLAKKDRKKLAKYLEDPSGSSILIIFYEGLLKKDVRDELKGIKFMQLDIRESDIPLWLKAKARSRGIALSDDAADFLIGTIGPDLGMLSSELDKCALIGKPSVDKEDIVGITEGKRRYNAFALIDAIKSGDPGRVFGIYRVLRDTEEPYALLGALNWQYGRLLAEAAGPKDKGYLHEVFRLLNKADLDMKSSGGSYPMEFLLVKLLRLSKRR